MGVELNVVKPARAGAAPSSQVFSVIADEMYFIPHFLEHYRELGVDQFHFLVDKSTDGSQEYLMSQGDAAIYSCNLSFGTPVTRLIRGVPTTQRFIDAARDLICKKLFPGRWALCVDADEFLVMPKGATRLADLQRRCDQSNLRAVRALMIDHFPESLALVNQADKTEKPLDVCPYFYPLACSWGDGESAPSTISARSAIRGRIHDMLKARGLLPETNNTQNHSFATWLFKTPLVRWDSDIHQIDCHRVEPGPSNRLQLAIQHFKFYPGWNRKVQQAIATGSYANKSRNYQDLALACEHLCNESLLTPDTALFVDNIYDELGIVFDSIRAGGC